MWKMFVTTENICRPDLIKKLYECRWNVLFYLFDRFDSCLQADWEKLQTETPVRALYWTHTHTHTHAHARPRTHTHTHPRARPPAHTHRWRKCETARVNGAGWHHPLSVFPNSDIPQLTFLPTITLQTVAVFVLPLQRSGVIRKQKGNRGSFTFWTQSLGVDRLYDSQRGLSFRSKPQTEHRNRVLRRHVLLSNCSWKTHSFIQSPSNQHSQA